MAIANPDPAGLYTGTGHLFTEEPIYASMSQIETARPWSALHSSAPVRSADWHYLKSTNWVSLPGSTRAPTAGIPAPASRRGQPTNSCECAHVVKPNHPAMFLHWILHSPHLMLRVHVLGHVDRRV